MTRRNNNLTEKHPDLFIPGAISHWFNKKNGYVLSIKMSTDIVEFFFNGVIPGAEMF